MRYGTGSSTLRGSPCVKLFLSVIDPTSFCFAIRSPNPHQFEQKAVFLYLKIFSHRQGWSFFTKSIKKAGVKVPAFFCSPLSDEQVIQLNVINRIVNRCFGFLIQL